MSRFVVKSMDLGKPKRPFRTEGVQGQYMYQLYLALSVWAVDCL